MFRNVLSVTNLSSQQRFLHDEERAWIENQRGNSPGISVFFQFFLFRFTLHVRKMTGALVVLRAPRQEPVSLIKTVLPAADCIRGAYVCVHVVKRRRVYFSVQITAVV